MAYAHTAFGKVKSELALRLSDAGNVFWVDDELGNYVIEALRTWGALTGYWRDRGTFNTVAGTTWYDLPASLPNLLGYTVTDRDLVRDIQRHLIEPATGISWTGSEMWTLADVTSAIERRRNQFLAETGRVVSHITQTTNPPPNGRVAIDESIIDIRRLAWRQPDDTTNPDDPILGAYSALWRSDEWEMDAFSPDAQMTPSDPAVYSVTALPPVTLLLSPPPANSGTLDMLVVESGPNLDPATGVVLGIPDDFCWIIKWGALADLLSGSALGRDPARAAYCEQRWQQGIQLATLMPCVLQVAINSFGANVLPVAAMDADSPDWQNAEPAQPTLAVMGGPNLLGMSSPPDDIYGVTVDVVRNAPIPAEAASPVQIGREELDVLIDYAFHLASFKEGGIEFDGSVQNLTRMIRMAAIKNSKLRAQSSFFDALGSLAIRDTIRRPRTDQDVPVDTGATQNG